MKNMEITMDDAIRIQFYRQLWIMIGWVKNFMEIIDGIPEISDQEQLDILKNQIAKIETNLKGNFNDYYRSYPNLINYNYTSPNQPH